MRLAAPLAMMLLLGAAPPSQAAEPTCWQILAAADGDNDDAVSAKEAAESLDRAFGRLDVDGDGAISPKEHQNCLLDAGGVILPVSPHRTQKRFAEVDADGDGSVSLDEYQGAGETAYGEAAEGGARATVSRYLAAAAEQGSGVADMDGDEFITASEAALDVLRTFVLMDVDGDRRITRLEWATVTERPRFARSFAGMDRNGDGRVSRPEFLAAGMSDGTVSVWRHAARALMPDVGSAQASRASGVAAGESRRR